jgi:capsular polysaccharide biosynthesis protein
MAPRFDLVEIIRTLQQKFRLILTVVIVAALVGAITFFVRKKLYKGKAVFFVANPIYIDRTNLFRADYGNFIDYFAKEDDLDKVMAIAKSDSLQLRVINKLNLGKEYKLNPAKPKELLKLMELFDGNYDIKRTEYTTLEVTYTDEDPELAAAVANELQNSISEMFSGYYSNLRNHVYMALGSKIKEMDTTIARLTDSLVILRDRYQIYDIISPSRRNLITGNVNIRSGVANIGRGVEEIQNLESIKDRHVTDRTEYLTVYNEFATSKKVGELPLVQSLTKASVPFKPTGFGLILTVFICGAVAFFFSVLWVLLTGYFRMVLNTKR